MLQLAAPRYRGKLAFAPGETDFQPIVTSVLRAYGKPRTIQWLDGIKANLAGHTYADNETIADEVNRGVVAFGVVNQYYWYRMRAEIGASKMHSLITYFAPHDPGYVINVSGAGILKSSKHQAAAQRFLAFLVSRQGQEIIAKSTSFEYPIGSGVKTAQPETPFDKLQPNPIDIGELGTGDPSSCAAARGAALVTASPARLQPGPFGPAVGDDTARSSRLDALDSRRSCWRRACSSPLRSRSPSPSFSAKRPQQVPRTSGTSFGARSR